MLKTQKLAEKSLNRAMLVAFGFSSFAAILFGGLAFSQDAFAGNGENNGQEEITICHVDQSTGEEKTITVGAPSVDKHLANHSGDHLGECTEITCQECYDSLVIEFDTCQDSYPCIQQAFEDFASCSLTCTGLLEDNFSQECVNSAAAHLDTCLDQSQSTDDVISCFDQGFYELLVACPAD